MGWHITFHLHDQKSGGCFFSFAFLFVTNKANGMTCSLIISERLILFTYSQTTLQEKINEYTAAFCLTATVNRSKILLHPQEYLEQQKTSEEHEDEPHWFLKGHRGDQNINVLFLPQWTHSGQFVHIWISNSYHNTKKLVTRKEENGSLEVT